jgi:nucleoside-diphosphate-sugar epimerase
MKVLFIGGTGVISSACTELALKKGIDLYHLNRGKSDKSTSLPKNKQLIADIHNGAAVQHALGTHIFDSVVDWISFVPDDLINKLLLFKDKTKQFVFISSASAYQTPPLKLPVTEETPLHNPFWQYSRDKAACESLLKKEAQKYGFSYTLVRPSHTYDNTLIPLLGGYTALHRIKNDQPVVVFGEGTSIWTLTHNSDFAKGLVGLLGNKKALNETFHITSDEWLTWNSIFNIMGEALGKKPKLIHVPSQVIARYHKAIGDGLLGDKSHSMLFDNTKIKSVVPEFACEIPFESGAKKIVNYYESHPDKQIIDTELNKMFDQIIKDYNR